MQGNMGDMPDMHVSSEEEFIVEMIPHHQEAVDTSLVIINNTENEDLRDLARRIVDAQRREIDMMEGWLDQYYDGGYEPDYQKMMPPLKQMSGEQQDIAYLRGMIRHHMMAVMMARQVLQLDPSERVEEFARNVTEVQTSEIREMRRMLQDY